MKPILAFSITGAITLLASSCGPLIVHSPVNQQPLPQPEVVEVKPVSSNTQPAKPSETVSSPSQKELRESVPTINLPPATTTKVNVPDIPSLPANLPVAEPIPSRPGWVFNPYNSNPVYVEGIPSGKTVLDPKDPNTDHKFRIP